MSQNNDLLTKLRSKIGSNVVPPKIIQSKFLNEGELSDIKSKVISLKQHWKYLKPESEANLTTRMLPIGMYSTTYDLYKEIVLQNKNLMHSNFFDTYEKIRHRVSDYFNCECMYHSDTNYPGFHIYVLPDHLDYGEYNWYNFHTDGFDFLSNFFSYDKIYSIVIPIELPKINGSLLYTLSKSSPKNLTGDSVTYNKMQYQSGDILVWQGNLIHSIEPFTLRNNECRITIQCHVAIRNNTGIIFW